MYYVHTQCTCISIVCIAVSESVACQAVPVGGGWAVFAGPTSWGELATVGGARGQAGAGLSRPPENETLSEVLSSAGTAGGTASLQ